MGALRVVNDKAASTWCLMCYPTLTDDATLVMDNAYQVYLNWRPSAQVRLNGHKLHLKAADGQNLPSARFNNAHDNQGFKSGQVIVDGAEFVIQAETPLDANGGALIFTNNAVLTFGQSVEGNGRRVWPIFLLGDLQRWGMTANGESVNPFWCWDPAETNKNCWDGPVYLGGKVPICNNAPKGAHNTGLTFNGPVSGTGGFYPYNGSTDIALQLNSLENTFTGGVVLGDGGRLIVRGNGSLPAAGAACSITNGSMILCGEDELSLPELKFHGTGLVERVSFVGGNAKGITKSGEGELVWNTSVGASSLELKGGSFTYPEIVPDWSRVAGLFEYTNKYDDATFISGEAIRVADHGAVLSPRAAYNEKNWSIPMPPIISSDNTKTNYPNGDNGCSSWIYSYRGYIWNQSDADVTWGLISVMDKGARVIIDGEIVVDQYNSAPSYSRNHAKTGAVTLSPGPHEFEFRYFCTSGNSGATKVTSGAGVFSYIDEEYFTPNADNTHDNPAIGDNGGKWTLDMGFGIDYQGARASHDYEDYAKAIDAGDGMLFTYTTNVLEVSAATPAFGEITAAAGTALDLSGREVALPKFTGLPAVHDGTLTVTESWVIPGADVEAGAAIAGTGKFVLASEAAITVDDLTALPRANFTLVETSGGVEIPEGLDGMRLDARGRYRLRVAGGRLTAEYSCGTKIIFR